MNDFNKEDVPLVPGSYYGYRLWRVNFGGSEDIPSKTCSFTKAFAQAREQAQVHLFASWHNYRWESGNLHSEHYLVGTAPPLADPDKCKEEFHPNTAAHTVLCPRLVCTHPSIKCGACGFYGYFNEDYWSSTAGDHPVVYGVIEAWGRLVRGDKGFRAQHARVVAISPAVQFPKNWNTDLDSYDRGLVKEMRREVRRGILGGIQLAYPNVTVYRNHDKLLKDYNITPKERQNG